MPDSNPFAAPTAVPTAAGLSGPLYSPIAVAVHAACFAPIVGCVMASINWSRAGDTKRANQTIAIGVGVQVAIVVIALYGPDALVRAATIGGGIGIASTLYREQAALAVAHPEAGAASVIPTVIAGIGTMIALFVGTIALAIALGR